MTNREREGGGICCCQQIDYTKSPILPRRIFSIFRGGASGLKSCGTEGPADIRTGLGP